MCKVNFHLIKKRHTFAITAELNIMGKYYWQIKIDENGKNYNTKMFETN